MLTADFCRRPNPIFLLWKFVNEISTKIDFVSQVLTKPRACISILYNSFLSYSSLILSLASTLLSYPNPNGYLPKLS